MIISILAVVFVFALLVWAHEFGHYWAARAVGVKVEVFSLGMGRRLFGFRRGDTLYQLAWFPIGGYVKMAGEENYEKGRPAAPDEFFGKPPGKKALVLVMGSLHNFLLGFLAFVVVFLIGLETLDLARPEIGSLREDYPAAAAGLLPGDRILAVEGEPATDWTSLSSLIHARPGRETQLVVRRGGETFTLALTPRAVPGAGEADAVGLIGIEPPLTRERLAFFGALARGGRETVRVGGVIFYYLGKLFTGEVSTRELAGPVGIARMTGQFAHHGFSNLLYFLALVSVNLGIVNLCFVFLPVVDGWHLLMVGIERLRGRRLSKRFLEVSQTAGVVLLALLFVLITYNDLLRLVHDWTGAGAR